MAEENQDLAEAESMARRALTLQPNDGYIMDFWVGFYTKLANLPMQSDILRGGIDSAAQGKYYCWTPWWRICSNADAAKGKGHVQTSRRRWKGFRDQVAGRKLQIWTSQFKIQMPEFVVLRLALQIRSSSRVLTLWGLLLLTACATHPNKSSIPSESKEFGLQGKALVARIEQATQILNLEIIVKEPSSARIEFFNSGLGVYLGRLIISQNKFLLVYSKEQKYFAGENAAEALQKWSLVPLSVEDFVGLPVVLQNLRLGLLYFSETYTLHP